MRTSKEQIIATSKAFDAELREALNYRDNDLTPEGLEKQRNFLADRVRAKYSNAIDEHRSALYYDRDHEKFDSYRPRLDWNKSGDVAKAQAKWAAVEKKLEAGLSIAQVIATADNTTLVAINEFYPDYHETQTIAARTQAGSDQYTVPDTSAVSRAVDDRAAEIGGTSAQNALKTARNSAGLHAYANVALNRLKATAEGRHNTTTDLDSALQADYAEQTAMAGGASIIETHDNNQDAGQEAATVSE